MFLQQLGNVYFQLFISLNGLISLFQSAAKRKTRFSKQWRKNIPNGTAFSSKFPYSCTAKEMFKWMAQSSLNFPMYLIKYINYIKHNKSNLITWEKWKGKADGVVNTPEHNLSTEWVSVQLSHCGNNTKLLLNFLLSIKLSSGRIQCLVPFTQNPWTLLLFSLAYNSVRLFTFLKNNL